MSYPIEKKFVIAVASSALFDLNKSDNVFRQQGVDKYREYQEKNVDIPFDKGAAFPFIKRLLKLNESFPGEEPVEVILMSKNSPETGTRVFRSIKHYGLNISRACFTNGTSHFQYLQAFNATLFLSANENDVKSALNMGNPAGRVLNKHYIKDDDNDKELRIAFDFDGVIASDDSEKVFSENRGNVKAFLQHEQVHANEPLPLGPIGPLLQKISFFQKLEKKKAENDKQYQRILKTAIVTARNAPAHERVVSSLKEWGVEVDEAFFLGGIEKSRILNAMKPHIFFDDKMTHLEHIENIPLVHIPFGIANK